jgi:PAS domain S-box-containing protein
VPLKRGDKLCASHSPEGAGEQPRLSPVGSHYRTLIEAADDAIFQLDRSGNYLFINEAGARRLGVQKEAMVGRNIRDFFPADALNLLETLESVFSSGQGVSVLRRVMIGRKRVDFSAILVPLKDSQGGVESVVVIARDVSRIRTLATAAKRNQRRIRELFNNMGEGVGIVDAEERFRFANPAANVIFGVSDGQLRNRNLREFVTEEGWQQIRHESLQRSQGLRNSYQLEIIRPDGERRFLQVTATPRRSRAGAYLGAFGVFYDVTLQRKIEQALRRTGEELEERVAQRTAQLSEVVQELQREIHQKELAVTAQKATEEELRESRERLRLLTASIESGREEECKRIAREIHDELGQNLTAAKYEIASLRKAVPKDHPELERRLDALNRRLDSVTEDVRRIARNLRPPLLDHFGLEAALECLAGDFQERTGIQCECQLGGSSEPIEEPTATSVFRICQEALTNVARHSNASLVELTLCHDGKNLLVQIKDDGRGITTEELHKPTLGLLGMEERARRVGGQLQIGPADVKGTKVDIVIPLRRT